MFSIAMLPARQGDCLWISYGKKESPHHLVVDGGPEKANCLRSEVLSRIKSAPDHKLHIDLLVATHIDNDHIGGLLDLLTDVPDGLTVGDLWFNGYDHIPRSDLLGPKQAERLTKILERKTLPWNAAFGGKAVMIPDSGELLSRTRQDVLKITVLGPTRSQLVRLGSVWKEAVLESESEPKLSTGDSLGRNDPWPPDIPGLARRPFEAENGPANGSSITLLLEYEGKQVLLAADAPAPALVAALDRLPRGDKRVDLRAFKISHHGSRKSTSTEVLKLVECGQFLISTDGSYFGHPDPEAVARILVHGGSNPLLVFNSTSQYVRRWKETKINGAPKFRTVVPDAERGIQVDLDARPSPAT